MINTGLMYTAVRAEYKTIDMGGTMGETLCVTFENGKQAFVANGDWSADNPAFAVLAFLGAKPSDLPTIENKVMPVVHDQDGRLVPANFTIRVGKQKLAEADWFAPYD